MVRLSDFMEEYLSRSFSFLRVVFRKTFPAAAEEGVIERHIMSLVQEV